MKKDDKVTNQGQAVVTSQGEAVVTSQGQAVVVTHVTSSFMGGATVRVEDVLRSSNAQQILQRVRHLRNSPDAAAPAPKRKTG